MNAYAFTLAGARLAALPSGALWWDEHRLLVVADLHLGRAERTARRHGTLLPPYDSRATLDRLAAEIARTRPATVVSLGDSFDDLAAADGIAAETAPRLATLTAGRRWLWITGNHDPGPVDVPGSHAGEHRLGPLAFRHIARTAGAPGEGSGEISGHYHPKARLRIRGQYIARPCFLVDGARAILPAFGAYTGGLDVADPALSGLVAGDACVLLTGTRITALPYPIPA